MTDYTYTTVSPEPNYTLLYNQITAAIPGQTLESLTYTGIDTTLIVGFAGTLTAGEETTLDSTVAAQDPLPLPLLQAQLIGQCGGIFETKQSDGFPYAGKNISGNINSLANFGVGNQIRTTETYPITIPTKDGTDYDITNVADFDGIFSAMYTNERTCLEDYATACNNIATAVTKTAAQDAYDAYAAS